MTDSKIERLNTALNEKPSPKDQKIEALESDLEKERDQRKEERFLFIVAVMIILNVFSFQNMDTWGGPISVVIIEIILILAISKRSGMEHIIPIVERLTGSWNKN